MALPGGGRIGPCSFQQPGIGHQDNDDVLMPEVWAQFSACLGSFDDLAQTLVGPGPRFFEFRCCRDGCGQQVGQAAVIRL